MLKYGFVVFLDGEATYDHVVQAKLPYANDLLTELKCSTQPVIAQRHYPSQDTSQDIGVSSPLFRYVSSKSGIDSYQSAFYLADALMRKTVLPVYLPETGEVKDLMPLLTDEQKLDAKIALQILRARYIKTAERKPASCFMIRGESSRYDSDTIELSDEEMLKIFGRLPEDQQDKVVRLRQADVVEEGRLSDESDELVIIDERAFRA